MWLSRLHNGKYCMMSNYSTSRLFNCMYANELRNRLAGKGVDVLVTHPGITVSDIEAKIERNHITGRLSKMTGIRPQPVDLGALSTIYAATNEDAHGTPKRDTLIIWSCTSHSQTPCL